jgi:toxin-antitoxin system PIN domain toxin
MISCDTNILFVALESSRPGHERARQFLEEHLTNSEFALCELVLLELYILLRNPVVARCPLSAEAAASLIRELRGNPRWDLLDYPGPEAGIMAKLWQHASTDGFARRKVFDIRLGLTLRHHGVTDFATANGKDFQNLGFRRVWNPLA